MTDLESAKRADTEAFKRFFHHALEAGVYFAPSPYETGFISLAHSQGDIEDTVEVMEAALRHAIG